MKSNRPRSSAARAAWAGVLGWMDSNAGVIVSQFEGRQVRMDHTLREWKPPRLPPLFEAAARGDIPALERLLASGDGVNSTIDLEPRGYTNGRRLTPLMVAAASNSGASVETLRWLLKQGADLHARSEGGSTAAKYCAGGDLNYESISGVDVDDHAERLALLLDCGLDPHEVTDRKVSLLGFAAHAGDPRRVRLLLGRGVSPQGTPADFDNAPLYFAVASGSAECVRLLLDAGADPLAKLRLEPTLLFKARSGESARLLLNAGVDPRARDKYGYDAVEQILSESSRFLSAGELDAARVILQALGGARAWDPTGEKFEFQVFQRSAGAVEVLLGAGANVLHRTHEGDSLLHIVSHDSAPLWHEEAERARRIAEGLIVHGCPVDLVNDKGETPLHTATFSMYGGTTAVVEVLLKHGAPCDCVDHAGVTPLMRAAEHREVEIMELLLAAGADPEHRSTTGESALEVARIALQSAEEYHDQYGSDDGAADVFETLVEQATEVGPERVEELRAELAKKSDAERELRSRWTGPFREAPLLPDHRSSSTEPAAEEPNLRPWATWSEAQLERAAECVRLLERAVPPT